MYNLYIGNKNYSSWSLRPWVLMRYLDIDFVEQLIPFHDKAAWAEYRKIAPNGLVPLLKDGETQVWDSLSITEYLAERHPGFWPTDSTARAFARSAAAEMHSGFSALRNVCNMNVGVRAKLKERPDALRVNLDRLSTLWSEGLDRFGGPFLTGADFTAVDAFFCPVAFRVQTYGLEMDEAALGYVDKLLNLPAMRDWAEAGTAETFRDLPHDQELADYATIIEDRRATAQ
jgi:glutathione S-transferase